MARFLGGYLARRPLRWPGLWRLAPALTAYGAGDHDRGHLKSDLIRMVMGGEPRRRVDAWADAFVADLKPNGAFRPAALAVLERHRSAGDHLVLLSASPDLYVPRIGQLLGFEHVLCTEIEWRIDARYEERLDGALKSANRRGEEKSRCLEALRTAYPGARVQAYGNAESDLPHLRRADGALLVNGNAAARRAAARLGMQTAEWT